MESYLALPPAGAGQMVKTPIRRLIPRQIPPNQPILDDAGVIQHVFARIVRT
jgi:hypothetical protein